MLHTCVLADGFSNFNGLKTNLKVAAKVDYENRRKVIPNHTMAHILNFALRDVLGPDVDQRGSAVNEEKLRFDFSCARSMTYEEIVSVEKIVNQVIDSKLEVSNQIVPLKTALEINGLRAVFGEVYPDPVRVISVGAPVNEIIKDPKKDSWRMHSVEFCGGTHLTNTGDARAFVLVEETAISKGIRRISGITGLKAVEAIQNGEKLTQMIDTLIDQVNFLSGLDEVKIAEDTITSARKILEEETLSQAVKSNARSQLEKLQKDVFVEKKKFNLGLLDDEVKRVKEELLKIKKTGASVIVLSLNIGTDSQAIKLVSDEVKKLAPEVAFMGLTSDSEKVSCFAFVPESLTGKFKANEWVSNTLVNYGGRGGGRPNNAQGSAPLGVNNDKDLMLKQLYESASTFY